LNSIHSEISNQVDDFERRALEISSVKKKEEAADICMNISSLMREMAKCAAAIEALNQRQKIVQIKLSQFPALHTNLEFVTSFENLWSLVSAALDLATSLSASPALSVNVVAAVGKISEIRKGILASQKFFFYQDEDPAVIVTEDVIVMLEETEKRLQICLCLQDKRIIESDWPLISSLCGFPVEAGTEYPLSKFVDSGTLDRLEEFRAILASH